eukprot:Nk52_evm7s1636 gene=Nk52_evmTU7s1636
MSASNLSVFKLIFTIVLVNVFLFTGSFQASHSRELLRDVLQFMAYTSPALTYQSGGPDGNSSLGISGVRSSSKNPYVTHFVDSYGYSHVNCSYNPFKKPCHHHNYNQLKYYSFLENAFTSSIIVSSMRNVSINSPFAEQDPGSELDIDDGHASIYGYQVENLSVNDTVAKEFIVTHVSTLELNNLATANFKANDVATLSGNVILPFLSHQSPKLDLVGTNKLEYNFGYYRVLRRRVSLI